MFLLIDVTTIESSKILLKADVREVQLWGQIHKAKGLKVDAPPALGTSFSKYDLLQLQYIYWNTFEARPSDDYATLVVEIRERMIHELEIDTTPVRELERLAPVAPSPPAQPPTGQNVGKGEGDKTTAVKPKVKKEGERPKEGSLTGAVWELCDELMATLGRMPERKEAIDYCVDPGGLHPATAGTQYSKWKKALTV